MRTKQEEGETNKPKGIEVGKVGWIDLTVDRAAEIRDFYQAVTGWTSIGLSMGDYEDFCMNDAEDNTIAGICHRKGENGDLPQHWLIYIQVSDLDRSLRECVERNGRVIKGPKTMGNQGRYIAMQDPAGAYAVLFEKWAPPSSN